MKAYFVVLLLLAVALIGPGCAPIQVEVGFKMPAELTVAASATRAQPAVSPDSQLQPASTPAPTGVSLPLSPVPQPTPGASDVQAAVQTLLDYFDALNQQDYSRAYRFWADQGTASGQAFADYARGFANTVRVTVQLGTATAQGAGSSRSVAVTLGLTSIVNEPDRTQRVQRYRGTYALRPEGAKPSGETGWQLVTASIDEVAGEARPPADVADPTTLLWSYVDAINRRELMRAYTYWDYFGRASKESFAEFERGFAKTTNVVIDTGATQGGAAAGSSFATVPVIVVASQNDGTKQTFCGTYTLRVLNVPPLDQLGWRIEDAELKSTRGVQPGSAEAKSLLAGGCPP